MPNTLFKESTITGEPGTAGSPSIPGIPGSPGYWKTETVPSTAAWQLSNIIAAHSSGQLTDQQAAAQIAALDDSPTTTKVFVPGTSGTPGTPGTPGTESTLVTDLNIGWNAGARSIQSEKGALAVEFTFSETTVAAGAGLNNRTDAGAVISDMRWTFEFEQGKIRIFEINEFGIGEFIVTTPATIAAGTLLKIVRDNDGVITYYIAGALVHTSTRLSFGVAFLEGLIYSADGA